MKLTIIIPTIGRVKELERLLESFVRGTQSANQIIIVEQLTDASKCLAAKFKEKLSIDYFSVDFKSLTKARNWAVKKAAGDIIGFLDDDIVLDKNYVKEVKNFFEKHPAALGVQGVITNFEQGHAQKVGGGKNIYKLYNLMAKIFLLNNSSAKNKLLLSGRNQYASRVKKVSACEWLSGIGNYKKRVFEEFSFDENLKDYALGEDKLFSYPIFRKHPNSLFVDPAIKCEHIHGQDGRPLDKAWVDMKLKYTYYLWDKLMRPQGFLAVLSYIWSNIGDIKTVFLAVLLRQKRFRFWWWHLRGYILLLCSKIYRTKL